MRQLQDNTDLIPALPAALPAALLVVPMVAHQVVVLVAHQVVVLVAHQVVKDGNRETEKLQFS